MPAGLTIPPSAGLRAGTRALRHNRGAVAVDGGQYNRLFAYIKSLDTTRHQHHFGARGIGRPRRRCWPPQLPGAYFVLPKGRKPAAPARGLRNNGSRVARGITPTGLPDFKCPGLIFETRGDLDQAEDMHRKAFEIDEQIGRREGMAIAYAHLGLIYQKRGDVEDSARIPRRARSPIARSTEYVGTYIGH